ncbi:non-canonical purine NTP pyrophosphatase [Vallitalea okinawensis]|uniref:non-canonical purine NTP pyrophosphatase n=1 Tax=Vallitalea okinawensis TaxID=2078660 RepID=UPI000CFAB86D|nr:non-canonical purine NTP pyrophosphatase [Vallitalea okinawensis]
MKILYGTTNQGKLNYMRTQLDGLGLEVLSINDIDEKVEDVEENGNLPVENAREKALAYYKATGIPVFSCDSGLFIDGLDNQSQPGVHVRRVGGKNLSDEEMISHYCAVVAGLGGEAKAQYKNAICLVLSETEIYEYHGDDLSYEKFILTSVPHIKRQVGFPLDSISKDIRSGNYFYDIKEDEYVQLKSDQIADAFRRFFIENLGLKGEAFIEKALKRSSVIAELEGNLNQGKTTALAEFWAMIEDHGAPIIENLSDDKKHSLVTFIYKGDETVDNVLVIPEIEEGQSLEYSMDRLLDTNLWYLTSKVRNDIRFEYFLSINDPLDDDWDRRIEQLSHDQLNKNFLLVEDENEDDNEILSHVIMPRAEEHVWVKEKENISKGTMKKYMIYINKLGEERRVRVYTPHGYNVTNDPYKFMVLTDGDEYINILSTKAVLDNLIAEKRISPTVVLFIDSTDTREEELSCNDIFLEVLADELMPWFRANYHISLDPKDGIIGGLSLGGLTAAYIGLKQSHLFGNVLSESGAFWYKPDRCEETERACWMSKKYNQVDKLHLKFYLNVGILEEFDNMIGVNRKLRDILQAKGYDVIYEEFKGGHDYLCWGETLANGLMALIGQ